MKHLLIAATVGLCLSLVAGSVSANENAFSGMQKYKAERVQQFLQRLNHSAVDVANDNELSTTLSFSNFHVGVVDSHLYELLSAHPRELPFTSVTYYLDDMSIANRLASIKFLKDTGVNVEIVKGHNPCEVNSFSGCKVYLIQFFATEKENSNG